MKFLLLYLIFSVSTALASDWSAQDICNVQADYVENFCQKYIDHEADVLKRCLVNEMEVQDFYLKKDFIVDSDLTVFCMPQVLFNSDKFGFNFQ